MTHRQGNTEQALDILNRILAQNPNHNEALLASARIIQDKDIDELNSVAWKRLERLIELGYKDASVYFNMAMISTKYANDNRAIELFEAAIRVQDTFIEAHYNLALLLIKKLDNLRQNSETMQNKQNIFMKAEKHLLKALKINSGHLKSMLVLGDLYAEEMFIEKSRYYYEMVINVVDGKHFRAKHNLCVLLHKEQKTSQAIECFYNLKDNIHNDQTTQQNIDLQIELLKNEASSQKDKIIKKNIKIDKKSPNNNESEAFQSPFKQTKHNTFVNDFGREDSSVGALEFAQMCRI